MVAEPGMNQQQLSIIHQAINAALNQHTIHTQTYVQETQTDFAQKIYDIIKAAEDKNESLMSAQLNDKIDSITTFLEEQLKQKDEELNKKIKELETNINISLMNIKENGMSKDNIMNNKWNKFEIFNKTYRLEQNEKWCETQGINTQKFREFKRKVLRYLLTGPEQMKRVLEYAIKQSGGINLKEKNEATGEMKHKEIIEEIPEIEKMTHYYIMNLWE